MPRSRKNVPSAVEESDREFARSIGIILPDIMDIEDEDAPNDRNAGDDIDPWNELHRAA